ncbi:MAG: MCE family protein [Bacteroidaceae bacterium]|jgi:phospholipid/cholesterol/gamma-HCH transport system substrate-binding protein|nr:MCE family protein [Bacteroidaceae bacterium]MBR0183398.1 MCE family protein [Bacteroidaceae bacterium]
MKKEYKIGVVGIVALVALFMGIRFLQGKDLFNTNHKYYVSFVNAKGLARSSKVYADGIDVGIVSDILYNYEKPCQVLVEISVDPRLVLRPGTRIQLDSGLMGGCTLNMYPSRNLGKPYQRGDTIPGYEQTAMLDKAAEVIPDVRQVIAKVDTLLTTLNRVAANPDIPVVISNVREVTSDLRVTTQRLNDLLGNDVPVLLTTYNQLGEHTTALVDHFKKVDIRPTIDSVNCTLSNVNSLLARIQSNEGTIGALINDRSMYNNLNHTIQSADSLVTDIKAHPKRYVHFSVFGRKDK